MQEIIIVWRQDRQSFRGAHHEANLPVQAAYNQKGQLQVRVALRECPDGLRGLDGAEQEIYAFLPFPASA